MAKVHRRAAKVIDVKDREGPEVAQKFQDFLQTDVDISSKDAKLLAMARRQTARLPEKKTEPSYPVNRLDPAPVGGNWWRSEPQAPPVPRCWSCGKDGHRQRDCPTREGNGGKGGKGKGGKGGAW